MWILVSVINFHGLPIPAAHSAVGIHPTHAAIHHVLVPGPLLPPRTTVAQASRRRTGMSYSGER